MKKCAFITGASSGFGMASAQILAKNGWDLILAARRQEKLAALQQNLTAQYGTKVHICALDVRERAQINQCIAQLPPEFQHINALINNAGLALGLEPAAEASLDNWQTMIDTNITGLVQCTHALLPILLKNTPATIVNLSSVAANWPYPGSTVYGASKAFVSQFSKNLRADYPGCGLRVTSLEPGIAQTEFSLVRFAGDGARAAKVYENVRALTAEDIGNIILWLLEQPAHININSLEVMPTAQTWNPLNVVREE